jgi:hypothetical protein
MTKAVEIKVFKEAISGDTVYKLKRLRNLAYVRPLHKLYRVGDCLSEDAVEELAKSASIDLTLS